MGGGAIGIFVLKWARILGAAKVAVFDLDDARLELAKRLGAEAALNVRWEDFFEAAMGVTGGRGFGSVFDTAGGSESTALALRLAAKRGSVGLIGTPHADLTFDWRVFELVNRKELTLAGSWMSHSAPFPGPEWAMTAERLADGRLTIEGDLIHRTLPMERAAEAFAMFKTPGAVSGRLMLVNS